MARSHPPTLLTSVRRTLREECGLGPHDHVLVAVSGGGDSLALLHALSRLGPELGLAVSAHGVDHGLRPEASA
jgi:tRNA(Ile)-lysidine synthase